ncbi:MAG: aminotransferase class V-fold PLP-dependent enzyme [Oscillospiraceae bacterium]
MVNFDNAATTFPKPISVKNAALFGITKYGGNPGRSGHDLSLMTANAVYNARKCCAEFFGAEVENTIFTLNCTHALNLAIKGILASGDHVIMSNMEHNSVSRPIFALSKQGCSFSIAKVTSDYFETVENFRTLITPSTKAIVCTIASNVTGQVLPYKGIAELCKKSGICFICDAAQGAGILPIRLSDGFNIICCAGHKGLFGITGTGLLITDGKFPLKTIIEGGTGSTSLELEQPDFLPDRLESGTINTVGALTLGAGVEFVKKFSVAKIHSVESDFCNILINGISQSGRYKIYRNSCSEYVPIVSFNLGGVCPAELAAKLNNCGFALRGGIHCAALAHNALGTAPDGTVRFAPSIFNSREQVYNLVTVLKKYEKSL